MATMTKRITVLVTAAEKRRIARLAKSAGLSMSQFMRQAAASFNPSDDKILEALFDQLDKSIKKTSTTVDDALAFIEASNQRIDALSDTSKSRINH